MMHRRHPWIATTLLAALAAAACGRPDPASDSAGGAGGFALEEATIASLQAEMDAGRLTARRVVELYLERIEQIDRSGPSLRSVLETNPEALDIADALDRERRARGARGPLHGIPVLVKDNIDTADRMMTTAGSIALEGPAPARDAFVVERMRQAGVVILGKANLSEWANFRSTHSVSGWSGRGGLVRNPYALDRNACGSSSGTGAAISASLAAVGVGTETDGSIVCPSSANGLVGIKPTVGLVSRAGIVPIAHSQDTAGPMARTVADAAALLAALQGVDPRDEATAASEGRAPADYSAALDPGGLRGARIGVLRGRFVGYSPASDRIFEAALAKMQELGAVLVDPAELPHAGEYDDTELEVLLYEFKHDLNAYLATRQGLPVKTLADLIAFNDTNREREMPYFGQEIFTMAQAKGPLTDEAYPAALLKNRRLAGAEGIDRALAAHSVVALVAPTLSPAWVTDLVNGDHYMGSSSTPGAVAGYPSVTVPAGSLAGLPVGVSFIGPAWSEATLISLAYAFEQGTKARTAPAFAPSAASAR
jgi:amidase